MKNVSLNYLSSFHCKLCQCASGWLSFCKEWRWKKILVILRKDLVFIFTLWNLVGLLLNEIEGVYIWWHISFFDIIECLFWLILPVVICLSQRLSHACQCQIDCQLGCERLIKSVIIFRILCSSDSDGNSIVNPLVFILDNPTLVKLSKNEIGSKVKELELIQAVCVKFLPYQVTMVR